MHQLYQTRDVIVRDASLLITVTNARTCTIGTMYMCPVQYVYTRNRGRKGGLHVCRTGYMYPRVITPLSSATRSLGEL